MSNIPDFISWTSAFSNRIEMDRKLRPKLELHFFIHCYPQWCNDPSLAAYADAPAAPGEVLLLTAGILWPMLTFKVWSKKWKGSANVTWNQDSIIYIYRNYTDLYCICSNMIKCVCVREETYRHLWLVLQFPSLPEIWGHLAPSWERDRLNDQMPFRAVW